MPSVSFDGNLGKSSAGDMLNLPVSGLVVHRGGVTMGVNLVSYGQEAKRESCRLASDRIVS